jgi:hypothetical protein
MLARFGQHCVDRDSQGLVNDRMIVDDQDVHSASASAGPKPADHIIVREVFQYFVRSGTDFASIANLYDA